MKLVESGNSIYVYAGVYSEPQMTLTEGINVVGQDEYSVVIQPSGNNNLFILEKGSSLAFLQIQNVLVIFYMKVTILR